MSFSRFKLPPYFSLQIHTYAHQTNLCCDCFDVPCLCFSFLPLPKCQKDNYFHPTSLYDNEKQLDSWMTYVGCIFRQIVKRCQREFFFLPWLWRILQPNLFLSRQTVWSNWDEVMTQLSSISTEQTFNRTSVEHGRVNLQNFPWATGGDKLAVEFPF